MANPMQRQKILMVDDTEVYLYTLNSTLKEDYDTIIAKSGEEGLDTARLVMPDLILLDVMMPGLSGYDVLEALKADEKLKSIPVILISGKDSDENEARGYELGAVDYIKKPFVRTEVKSRIDSVMKASTA